MKGVHETILTKIMQIPSLWHGTRYFNCMEYFNYGTQQ